MGIGIVELIIIGIVLIVLLAGVVGMGVLIYVVAIKGRTAKALPSAGVPSPNLYNPGAAAVPSPAQVPAAPVVPSPAAGSAVVRMLAAPDCAFSNVDHCMRQCSLAMQGAPGRQVAAGEPESAVWSDGKHQVSYRYDARNALRMIEITGPNAKYVRNDILNDAYLPTLEGYKVSGLLQSQDPAELLRGIFAAEFIGINGDQKYYLGPVGQLLGHGNPQVREAAQRVHAALTSR